MWIWLDNVTADNYWRSGSSYTPLAWNVDHWEYEYPGSATQTSSLLIYDVFENPLYGATIRAIKIYYAIEPPLSGCLYVYRPLYGQTDYQLCNETGLYESDWEEAPPINNRFVPDEDQISLCFELPDYVGLLSIDRIDAEIWQRPTPIWTSYINTAETYS